jgi:hypothetical protein
VSAAHRKAIEAAQAAYDAAVASGDIGAKHRARHDLIVAKVAATKPAGPNGGTVWRDDDPPPDGGTPMPLAA